MDFPSSSGSTPNEPEWSLEWDTTNIAQADVERQREEWTQEDHGEEPFNEDEAFVCACADSDLYRFEWDHLTECLTDKMKELAEKADASGDFWWVEVACFGWRKQNGYKKVTASDGPTLLQEVLPKTDCTFTVTPAVSCTDHYDADDNVPCFHLRNSHHDAPTGESYYLWPAKLCAECDEIVPAHGLVDGKCDECRKSTAESTENG